MRSEFDPGHFATVEAALLRPSDVEAPADEHSEKLFARFDSNGDGAIATDELPQRRERRERRDANR